MDCESIICDANNLYEAYLKTIKGSKWKETTQKFALNYLRNIFKIQEELRSKTYKPGCEGHFVLHERGKIRPITTLQPRDRIVRHVLCDEILLPAIMPKIIYDNYASIKDRGISLARKRFEVHLHQFYQRTGRNDGYILLGDYEKFYDNIIHEIAKQMLLDLFDQDPYLTWLLDTIFENFQVDVSYLSDEDFENYTDYIFNRMEYLKLPKECLTGEKFMEKSVNIGDQLSQDLGIYYPHRIDNYVKIVLGKKEYGRYMDDFYVMSEDKNELIDILNRIGREAKELGIHINRKKTRIVNMGDSYRYLQVKYTMSETGHITKRINPKRVTSMRRRLKSIAEKVNTGERAYEPAEEMFRSWMGSFYKLMSKDQRKNLISLYEELFNKKIRFQKISGKRKMVITERRSQNANEQLPEQLAESTNAATKQHAKQHTELISEQLDTADEPDATEQCTCDAGSELESTELHHGSAKHSRTNSEQSTGDSAE